MFTQINPLGLDSIVMITLEFFLALVQHLAWELESYLHKSVTLGIPGRKGTHCFHLLFLKVVAFNPDGSQIHEYHLESF